MGLGHPQAGDDADAGDDAGDDEVEDEGEGEGEGEIEGEGEGEVEGEDVESNDEGDAAAACESGEDD